MAKTKKKKVIKAFLPPVVKQHNLETRFRRGEILVDVGEDPDNPKQKVTRLRRKCVYDEMMNRGTITKQQRDCAERYEILCEKTFGRNGNVYARIGSWLSEGRVNGHAWEPTEAQHHAYGKLFRIWQELGRHQRDIIHHVVLGNMNAVRLSEVSGKNRDFVMGQVVAAFERLEEVMG